MTNTKFRKRALLSSVAMLLVALVALGSATFAWFTENPQVTASGIVAYGQTSQGLEIQTATDPGYKEGSAQLMKVGSDLKLVPAYALQGGAGTEQSPYAVTLLTANAALASESAPTGNWSDGVSVHTATNTQTTIGAKVYKEHIDIKAKNIAEGESEPTVNLTGVTITGNSNANAPDIKDGVTVMIVVKNEIKKIVKLGGNAILNYDSAANGAAVGSASGTYSVGSPTTGGTFSGSVPLGTAGTGIGSSAVLGVDVYVYLDGTDTNVYTNNASVEQLISGVSLTFAK